MYLAQFPVFFQEAGPDSAKKRSARANVQINRTHIHSIFLIWKSESQFNVFFAKLISR